MCKFLPLVLCVKHTHMSVPTTKKNSTHTCHFTKRLRIFGGTKTSHMTAYYQARLQCLRIYLYNMCVDLHACTWKSTMLPRKTSTQADIRGTHVAYICSFHTYGADTMQSCSTRVETIVKAQCIYAYVQRTCMQFSHVRCEGAALKLPSTRQTFPGANAVSHTWRVYAVFIRVAQDTMQSCNTQTYRVQGRASQERTLCPHD